MTSALEAMPVGAWISGPAAVAESSRSASQSAAGHDAGGTAAQGPVGRAARSFATAASPAAQRRAAGPGVVARRNGPFDAVF